jgi:hypothetical protein
MMSTIHQSMFLRGSTGLTCYLGMMVVFFIPTTACADGGTLRFSKLCDGYRITLFTAPTPLRAGTADFSVLLQAADSETPLLDVPVSVHVYPVGEPQRRRGGLATTAVATNKLFQAIALELPEAGTWRVEIEVQGPERAASVEADLKVEPPMPAGLDLAFWIAWPAGAIVLFAFHQRLVRRVTQRGAGQRRV